MERLNLRTGYDRLMPIAVIVILFAGLWPALEVLSERWLKFDESYSHGFMVLVVSLALTLHKWVRMKPRVGAYPFWLLPLSMASLVYLAGSILLIEAAQQLALLPLVLGSFLLIWGWEQTKPFFLPLGILAFTIPVWDYVSWPLQVITVSVNDFLLSFFNIEFYVEGVFVYFPGVGAFEIAHGCSGLRYLLVGLTLCTLYGELNYSRVRTRGALIAAGIFLALVANWIRVFVIIYIGYESNMTSSLINEHDFFGWWVFAGTLVPLFFLARWLEGIEAPLTTTGSFSEGGARKTTSLVPMAILVFGPLVLFSATALGLDARQHQGRLAHALPSLEPLLERDQWLPLFRSDLEGWAPVVRSPDAYRVDVYLERESATENDKLRLEVLSGLYIYGYQRPGGELVGYHNRLFDRALFMPVETFEVDAGDGASFRGMRLKLRQSGKELFVAYGYNVEGRWESDKLRAKLAQIPGIFNGRTDASLMAVGVSCEQCNGQAELEKLTPLIRKRAEYQLQGWIEKGS
ncbi:exosortase [Marinobacter litoralis]|uniref:exosortase n=1 Tax=Marinobacter litoralis TaxID=187981 RepID=UPI0018EB550D|nr:exosortase [Marinobacter litoralis]MBJ6137702.1 exosortase/archaeosortase family protein [Marinobacter litoralis]